MSFDPCIYLACITFYLSIFLSSRTFHIYLFFFLYFCLSFYLCIYISLCRISFSIYVSTFLSVESLLFSLCGLALTLPKALSRSRNALRLRQNQYLTSRNLGSLPRAFKVVTCFSMFAANQAHEENASGCVCVCVFHAKDFACKDPVLQRECTGENQQVAGE